MQHTDTKSTLVKAPTSLRLKVYIQNRQKGKVVFNFCLAMVNKNMLFLVYMKISGKFKTCLKEVKP